MWRCAATSTKGGQLLLLGFFLRGGGGGAVVVFFAYLCIHIFRCASAYQVHSDANFPSQAAGREGGRRTLIAIRSHCGLHCCYTLLRDNVDPAEKPCGQNANLNLPKRSFQSERQGERERGGERAIKNK